jgi:hypothetical protein
VQADLARQAGGLFQDRLAGVVALAHGNFIARSFVSFNWE